MFKRYFPKGGKLNFEGDSVRVSNQALAFSNQVWEKCFNKCPKMALFFEEETNQIGLRGNSSGIIITSAHHGDYKLAYKVVRWEGFIKAIKFNFERPAMRKLVQSNNMWVIEKDMAEASSRE